jgi:hypothetical protein
MNGDWDADDDEWGDDTAEYGGEADDSGDEPTVPCPSCGQDILEDSPRCPHCERYISTEDHPGPAKTTWVVVTALICLGMAIRWVLAVF